MVLFAISESWLLKTGFQNGNIFFDQDSPIPNGHERKPKEKTEYPPNFSNHCGRRVKKFLFPDRCIPCLSVQGEDKVVTRWFERRRNFASMESVFHVITGFSTASHLLNLFKLFVHHHEVELLKFPEEKIWRASNFKLTCVHRAWCNFWWFGRSKYPNWADSQTFEQDFLWHRR